VTKQAYRPLSRRAHSRPHCKCNFLRISTSHARAASSASAREEGAHLLTVFQGIGSSNYSLTTECNLNAYAFL